MFSEEQLAAKPGGLQTIRKGGPQVLQDDLL